MDSSHRTSISDSTNKNFVHREPPTGGGGTSTQSVPDKLERDFHILAITVLGGTDSAGSPHASYPRNAICNPPVPDVGPAMDSSRSRRTSPILGEWSSPLAPQQTNISTSVSREDQNGDMESVTSHNMTATYRHRPCRPHITPIITARTTDGWSFPMHLLPPERGQASTPPPSAATTADLVSASSETPYTPPRIGSNGEGMEQAVVMHQAARPGVVLESAEDNMRLSSSVVGVLGFVSERRGNEVERMGGSVAAATNGTLKRKADGSSSVADARRARLNTTIRPQVKTATTSQHPTNSTGLISPMPQTPPPKAVVTPAESGVGHYPAYLSPPQAPRKPRESPGRRCMTPGARSRAKLGQTRLSEEARSDMKG